MSVQPTTFCNFSWLLMSRSTYLALCSLLLLLLHSNHQHTALACGQEAPTTDIIYDIAHTSMHKHPSSLLPSALRQQTTRRVTLIGDSILDNKAYVRRTLP